MSKKFDIVISERTARCGNCRKAIEIDELKLKVLTGNRPSLCWDCLWELVKKYGRLKSRRP